MSWIERPIGIDLGTTNSASAMLSADGQSLWLAEDAHGRAIVPSVVGYEPEADALVTGFVAWNRRGLDPEPVQSVKRKMGLAQTVELGPLHLTPPEISAEILRSQRTQMVDYLARQSGERAPRVERAVITVPAYFDAPQIEATREAGELAGLEVLGLLQEPTAACMYCVWKRGLGDGTFLVYDLGGGTFDVSVIRSVFGEYQVLGIHGDNYLGGDDFDRRLAEYFRRQLQQRGYRLELDIANDPDDALRFLLLTRIARAAKEALSTEQVHYVARRDLFTDQAGQLVTLELELSRAKFDELMEDLVDSTVRCCHEALERAREKAGVTLEAIDHVLLVGGSTRVPLVQRKVADAFCGPGKSRAEAPTMEAPDSCVALGAAIHAANLGGVRLGDDDAAVRIELTSPLASASDRIRLSGLVAGEGADGVTTVLLKDSVGATLGIESLGDDRRFKLVDVPLPDDGDNPVALELLSDSGATRCELPLVLHRSVELKRTGSALSNPTVLAKDIYLEVQRNGELDRKILVSRGATLPARESFRLYTGDQSGAVILTLLQSRYPISSVHLEVPRDLTVGSPVELALEIDEKMTLTAQGGVGGQTFWAQIEPPPARELKAWSAIEGLIAETERLGQRLWGHEARIYRRDAPFLLASIREAVHTDPDKLQVLVSRLEDLLEYLRGAPGELTPGFERFEIVLDNIRRIVLRADETLGLDFAAWEDRLATLRAEGRAAFEAHDQTAWSRAYTKVQALFETVSQEESRFIQTNSLEHVMSLFNSARFRLELLREKLDSVVLPRNPETRRLRERALAEIVDALEREISAPLDALAPRLAAGPELRGELERINTLARQLDKRIQQLPSLGVVVSHE